MVITDANEWLGNSELMGLKKKLKEIIDRFPERGVQEILNLQLEAKKQFPLQKEQINTVYLNLSYLDLSIPKGMDYYEELTVKFIECFGEHLILETPVLFRKISSIFKRNSETYSAEYRNFVLNFLNTILNSSYEKSRQVEARWKENKEIFEDLSRPDVAKAEEEIINLIGSDRHNEFVEFASTQYRLVKGQIKTDFKKYKYAAICKGFCIKWDTENIKFDRLAKLYSRYYANPIHKNSVNADADAFQRFYREVLNKLGIKGGRINYINW